VLHRKKPDESNVNILLAAEHSNTGPAAAQKARLTKPNMVLSASLAAPMVGAAAAAAAAGAAALLLRRVMPAARWKRLLLTAGAPRGLLCSRGRGAKLLWLAGCTGLATASSMLLLLLLLGDATAAAVAADLAARAFDPVRPATGATGAAAAAAGAAAACLSDVADTAPAGWLSTALLLLFSTALGTGLMLPKMLRLMVAAGLPRDRRVRCGICWASGRAGCWRCLVGAGCLLGAAAAATL
jgi:hypothetical protein